MQKTDLNFRQSFVAALFIGMANVIPGVSGGTLAFVFGLYEKILCELKKINKDLLKKISRGSLKEAITEFDLKFIGSFVLGALLGVILLSHILTWSFEKYPENTWAFFFGLILGSILILMKDFSIKKSFPFLLVGILAAFMLSKSSALNESSNIFYLMLCGALAISSMVIPGISGSHLLIVLGNYKLALEAVKTFNFSILIPFAIGCALGFLVSVRVIDYFLKNFREKTLALICGFIIGSLGIIWPWKEKLLQEKEEFVNILPPHLNATLLPLCMALLGFVCIYFLEKKLKHKP